MATEERWQKATEALTELGAFLHVDFRPETLQLSEGPDTVRFKPGTSFERAGLGTADELDKVLLKLKDKYGPVLRFWIKHKGTLALQFDQEYDRSRVDEFYKNKIIAESTELELDLETIVKSELLSYWGFTHPSVTFKMFLYADALERALDVPLTQLDHGEDALFQNFTGERKLLILLPEHEIELDGDYLAVLGGNAVAQWQKHLRPDNDADAEAEKRRKYIFEKAPLNRVRINLHSLTPPQLNVDWKSAPQPAKDDPVAGALYAQLFALSLLYMARESGPTEGPEASASTVWIATFQSEQYLAKFDVGEATALRDTLLKARSGDPWRAAQTIGEMASWIYKDELYSDDQLAVVQNVVSSALQGSSPADNCEELMRQGDEIFRRVQRGWDSFINKRLTTYFELEKAFEETIETTSKGYNEQVQSLTKSLSDNMLAAVAIVVGSFIAGMFKSPFQPYMFWFGTGVYVAYLLIFPMIVGLTATWQRFNDSRKTFNKRKTDFASRLTEKHVDDIVDNTVAKSEHWFKSWLWWTTGLYIFVLAAVACAAIWVPGWIKCLSDRFVVTGASYGTAANGIVPMIIRGENFDKDKEIVVTIGGLTFSNTDGQSLNVLGTTVLTLSPRQRELRTATQKRALFTVRQGTAAPKAMELPKPLAP